METNSAFQCYSYHFCDQQKRSIDVACVMKCSLEDGGAAREYSIDPMDNS